MNANDVLDARATTSRRKATIDFMDDDNFL